MPDAPVEQTDARPGSDEPNEAIDLARAVDQIELGLIFEVGRKTITLAQLKTVQSGYVFELDAKVSEPVTIRANGKSIGTGALVDIEGRIGVRLLEINDG